MSIAWLLAELLLCTAVIGRAGYALCGSADRLAARYGWGRGWVGLALLATVTSLPELSSSIGAVAVVGAPNLAVGGLLGACVFNLGFLVVVDLLQRDQPIYRTASATHLLSAAFGIVMLGSVALSIVTAETAPAMYHVGVYSPALLAIYLLALRSVHLHERELLPAGEVAAVGAHASRDWRHFALAAALVVAAGLWLPQLADRLAGACSYRGASSVPCWSRWSRPCPRWR
jgi:cation:H+ antiporter